MKRDQRGFSLVELIIVIAIMSIVIGIGVRNMGVIQRYRCRECQDKLINSIQAHKVDALSKSVSNNSAAYIKNGSSDPTELVDAYLKIERDNGFYYVTSTMPNAYRNTIKISKSKTVKINYVLDGTPGTVEDGDVLYIAFNRSTGAFLPCDGGKYYSQLSVSVGDYERFITLQSHTGKILRNK